MALSNKVLKAKWIKGYEDLYQILSDGNILSFKQNKITGRFLAIKYSKKTGFGSVNLVLNGENNYQYIHRLVAESFIKNPQPKVFTMVVHKDGDKSNNAASNLLWTDKEGKFKNQSKYRKKQLKESDMYSRKLSNDDVELITHMFKNKTISRQSRKIPALFNVSHMSIQRLTKSKKFKQTVLQLEKDK